ncbi:MGH1-like glycoside hydrolase domain-containing protein [Rhizosaccharibacter radicis]|uniref:RICIN domain-containing protein n=1 Tax=Rhizosaccharibacter radicis TaxID=2782605 RepID=A0ABT1VUS1_9PROT|nr:RICIN domain-containing protein [Acetobacteraceae bacterium KSS12]
MLSRTFVAALVAAISLACPEARADTAPSGPAPAGTHFLPHATLLGAVDDPNWFLRNIPFLEVPDAQIQQVYYYRWETYKEHLAYTGSIYGYLSTEFLQPVFYGAPYGGVVAAAGHQTIEGRWLRDQRYVKDNINYWLNGPGRFPKPQDDSVNADTSDWAHEYSFWAGTAVWQSFLASGDRSFAFRQLPNLVRQYRGWDNHFNPALGLYWQVPVWDATEFTPASFETSDPYHGGAGYRPTINSYQYGDAVAIANLARLSGDVSLSAQYATWAALLAKNTHDHLWDPGRQFYFHRQRDNNPTGALLDTREEEGFVPWMFGLPRPSDARAMAQLLDPQGFAAPFGPTTAERRSRWFNFEAKDCCHWDGPSWPYETSQTLTGVANLLQDGVPQRSITRADYLALLHGYAATQFRNGSPYVAEAHDPDSNVWIYDSYNHSEDYNHSTFNDNVISGLIGLRGQTDDTLLVDPLAPASWDYFALENAPYHGHDVSVLWDRTGGRYNQGAGLRVYVDGRLAGERRGLSPLLVPVGRARIQDTACGPVDVAANSQKVGYGPTPSASYTSPYDDPWRAVDGVIFRSEVPENSRWTSYNSSNGTDWFQIDFGRNVSIAGVTLFFYDDGGGVRVPASYRLQYWNNNDWADVPGQSRHDPAPVANASNAIDFPLLSTSRLRVLAPNAGGGTGWGLQEMQAWGRAVFRMVNQNSLLPVGVPDGKTRPGEALAQEADDGAASHAWEFLPEGDGWFTIRNLGTGLLMGVGGTANSIPVVQGAPGGGDAQLWRFADEKATGQFKVINKRSGKLLGIDTMSKAPGGALVQFEDNGTADHLWQLQPTETPAGAPPARPCRG